MSGRKITSLRFYWISLMTGVITFWYSLKVIVGSIFVRKIRPLVDQAMYIWASKLLNLIQVRVVVTGREHMPANNQRPVLIMCNHTSLYDIPVSAVALNTSLRMLAKKELFKIPIFSSALRRGEFLSIDRNNREQSIKDLKNAKTKMLDGIILWVAPEGTRSKNGRLGQFKRGGFHIALDAGALIIPLVIKNIDKVQSGDNLTLTIDQDVNVEICEPVDTANYSYEQRKKLVQDVRNRMLTALGQ